MKKQLTVQKKLLHKIQDICTRNILYTAYLTN